MTLSKKRSGDNVWKWHIFGLISVWLWASGWVLVHENIEMISYHTQCVFHFTTIIYGEFRNQSCYYPKSTTTKAAVFLRGRSGCATTLMNLNYGIFFEVFKPRAWCFKLSFVLCKISQKYIKYVCQEVSRLFADIYWHRLSILCQWARLKEICHHLRWFLEWQRHRLQSKK